MGMYLHPQARQLQEALPLYMRTHTEAANVVLRRLGRLSDRQLTANAAEWLGQSWLLIDLLDDIAETTPGRASDNEGRRRGSRR